MTNQAQMNISVGLSCCHETNLPQALLALEKRWPGEDFLLNPQESGVEMDHPSANPNIVMAKLPA